LIPLRARASSAEAAHRLETARTFGALRLARAVECVFFLWREVSLATMVRASGDETIDEINDETNDETIDETNDHFAVGRMPCT